MGVLEHGHFGENFGEKNIQKKKKLLFKGLGAERMALPALWLSTLLNEYS